MRYRLRTLLILMAVLPPMLAGAWSAYRERLRRAEHLRQEHFRLMMTITPPLVILEEEEFTLGIELSEP